MMTWGRSGTNGNRPEVAIVSTPFEVRMLRTRATVSGSVPEATISTTDLPSVTLPLPSTIDTGAGYIAGNVVVCAQTGTAVRFMSATVIAASETSVLSLAMRM
jgi:hypothetical protein